MKMQMSLEDRFTSIAKNQNFKSVILCDRGLMDTLGYTGPEIFDRILEKAGWTKIMLRDHRYDAVIHMVTAADGAAQFYNNDNEARFEDVEEAIIRDRALRECYIGHNKLYVIDNRDTFGKKVEETINTVLSIVGQPTNKVKFKKFLVDTRNVAQNDCISCSELH